MNPWLQRLLGGGQMALGAFSRNPNLMRGGFDRATQGYNVPTPIAPTPLPSAAAGMPMPQSPVPVQQPPRSFRMPSAYGYDDNNGLF